MFDKLKALFQRKQDNPKPSQEKACCTCDDYADPANPLSPFSPLNPIGFGGHSLPAGGLGMASSEKCGCCASCDGCSADCNDDSDEDSGSACFCDSD